MGQRLPWAIQRGIEMANRIQINEHQHEIVRLLQRTGWMLQGLADYEVPAEVRDAMLTKAKEIEVTVAEYWNKVYPD